MNWVANPECSGRTEILTSVVIAKDGLTGTEFVYEAEVCAWKLTYVQSVAESGNPEA
jgi:hypothetical protein